MTYRERLEARLQRRQEWAASRARKAEQAFAKAHTIGEGIPFGQPILVGHHSERRHRNDIAKIDGAIRSGVESCNMRDHHTSKAGGIAAALDSSIFSDDPDAVEALERKAAECDALAEFSKRANRAYKSAKGAHGWQAALGTLTDEQEKLVAYRMSGHRAMWGDRLADDGRPLHVKYPPFNPTKYSTEARRCRQRLEEVKRRQGRLAKAEAAGGVVIEGTGEYIRVTFSEKPERSIIDALKAADFRWGGGSWTGKRDALPACVQP